MQPEAETSLHWPSDQPNHLTIWYSWVPLLLTQHQPHRRGAGGLHNVCSSKFSMSLARYKNTAAPGGSIITSLRVRSVQSRESRKMWGLWPSLWHLDFREAWKSESGHEESRHGRDSLHARIFQKYLFTFVPKADKYILVCPVNKHSIRIFAPLSVNEPVDEGRLQEVLMQWRELRRNVPRKSMLGTGPCFSLGAQTPLVTKVRCSEQVTACKQERTL